MNKFLFEKSRKQNLIEITAIQISQKNCSDQNFSDWDDELNTDVEIKIGIFE